MIATAGHVDHGKSSLVLALTGTDPDRFAEEKRRGLTIDLGFAHTTRRRGEAISFVDVPGHVRFLRNMLAGVGGVDACLFVVAATEGWKPQSEEHLRILELLGVRHGVVALTKVDLLDDAGLSSWRAGGRRPRRRHVPRRRADRAGRATRGSARRPARRARPTSPPHPGRRRPRPAASGIDRVFAARGSGTVVTGHAHRRSVAAGDHVVVEPAAGRRGCGRSRRIGTVDRIGPGTGSPSTSPASSTRRRRGRRRRAPGRWRHRRRRRRLAHRARHARPRRVPRAAPTSPTSARASTPCACASRPESVAPGDTGAVCGCTSRVALPLLPGDRYVLRETGRDETVGGGEVLDVAPVLPASRAARPPSSSASSPSGAGSTPTSWSC